MSSFSLFVKTTIKRIKTLIKKHPKLTVFLIGLTSVIISYVISKRIGAKQKIRQSVLTDFIAAVNNDLVSEIVMKSQNLIVFKTIIGKFFTDPSIMEKSELFNLISSKQIKFRNVSNQIRETFDFVLGITAFLSSIGVSIYLIKKNSPKQYKFNQENEKRIKFQDIYGLQKPKQILQETIDYLKDPKKYEQMGCRLRTGIIFYGPPGTGKTMLAKAMATQSNSQFISCTASEFCQMYVGVGPKRIRQLFNKAKKYQSSVIFIDEIDAIGHRRDDRDSDERNNTLNQLLTQMNGFVSNKRIVVIAATNRIEMIDSALLRSGRFDVKIQIPLPDQHERKGILQLHLSKRSVNLDTETINRISKQSQGMCGADLQSLINEAAYKTLRNKKTKITEFELEQSFLEMKINMIKRRK